MNIKPTVINLTSAHDTYTAAAGDYVINGLGGNDTITTGAGNSTLNLGDGNATITTGAGNSIVNAGNGNSTITTGAGNSLVTVGDGNATITTGAGDSTVTAGKGNNTITTGAGNNTVHTLAGDQTVTTGAGNDEIDVGVGSSTVVSAAGNDVLVYHAAGNQNTSSTFDGGTGIDTLRLALTRAEWMSSAVQADVAKYLTFLSAHTGASGEASAAAFKFSTFGLTASSFEKLQVTVDGVQIDPANHAVTLGDDVISTTENEASIAVNVLGNDSVPDLIKTFTYTNPSHGSVHLDAAYSDTASPAAAQFIYTPTAGFYDHLAVGQTATDAFTYTVTDATGDVKTAIVNVTITGTNDVATITGSATGSVTEDTTLSASGTLTVADVDDGEAVFRVQTNSDGIYGKFSIDALGSWTYALNNNAANVQALNTADHVSDHFTVLSQDGTSKDVTISIDGKSESVSSVIDFEDVAVTSIYTPIPDGYKGFNWDVPNGDNLYVINENVHPGSGYERGSINPGKYAAFNPFALSPVNIHRTNDADFTFNKVYVTGAWQVDQVTFQGFNNGVLIGTTGQMSISNLAPSLVEVNWAPIDNLRITIVGSHVVFDNFSMA